MNAKYFLLIACAATTAWGQGRITDRRTAEIRGGGGQGKCTIEVAVDDTADVEIDGRNAVIRTISGTPATFRRFQCNQQMPQDPGGFRFEGVDGRGSQNLVRQANNGRPAVIRIVDSRGGSEAYTLTSSGTALTLTTGAASDAITAEVLAATTAAEVAAIMGAGSAVITAEEESATGVRLNSEAEAVTVSARSKSWWMTPLTSKSMVGTRSFAPLVDPPQTSAASNVINNCPTIRTTSALRALTDEAGSPWFSRRAVDGLR